MTTPSGSWPVRPRPPDASPASAACPAAIAAAGLRWIGLGALLLAAAPPAATGADDLPVRVDVEVHGIDDDAVRRNVLLFLSIARAARNGELDPGRVRTLHARAPGEIRQALAPYGLYHPHIEAELTPRPDRWQARYRVEPGPRMVVTEADIRITGAAADDPEFRRLRGEQLLRPGDPLLHSRYEDDKRTLQLLARERGYFDARFTAQALRIDVAGNSAQVVLHLDSGPAYRFGELRFDPPQILAPALLARYVRFRPGDPFRYSQLLDLQRALVDSQYFHDVEVRPDVAAADGLQVPVEVRMTARTPNRYRIGAGYGTDTGARASANWDRRPLNADGHHASAGIGVSRIRQAVATRYTVPVGDPRTDQLVYTASSSEDRPETSTSRTGILSTAYGHRRGRWRETLSLAYQQESFRTGTDSGRTGLLIPGIDWLWVEPDDRLAPPRGWRVGLQLRGASESLASDLSFAQARVHGKLIWPVAGAGRLLTRFDGGTTSVSSFEDLPATLRFYAGGDQSIRGYEYNVLGPVDATGQVIGGRHLTVASLEYEQRLAEKWSAALFYDAGRAFSTGDEPYSAGAGTGVRWRSPIGPVRLDVAWAVSEPDRPWRLHLIIGPDL